MCTYVIALIIIIITDYLANRHETVQARRYEYEPPCPPFTPFNWGNTCV